MHQKNVLVAGLIFLSLLANPIDQLVVGQNWPQWRGANYDSAADEAKLPEEFGLQKNLFWRVELPGPAGASPVVHGSRIFLTSQIGERDLGVVCVSTEGKMVWQHKFEKPNRSRRMDNANAASPSPVTDGKHVWAAMGTGELRCLTVEGELVWKFDIQNEFGKFKLLFGYASSPVLLNDRLYVVVVDGDMRSSETSEGKLICLNAKTGETEWVHSRKTNARAENLHSYASLTVWPDKGQDLLLVHGADYLTAHRAMDGKEVWRMGDLNGSGGKYNNALRFVSSPGIGGGRVIVPSAKNGPMVCLDPKQAKGNVSIDDDAVVWRLSKGTPDVATPVVYRDVVYVVTKKGLLAAHDLTDGRSLYRERLVADKHRSTPIVSDGKIFVVGRDGVVAIVKAGEKFKVLAKCELKEEATSSPAVADGVLYIRTWKAIYAFRKAPDD